MTRALDRRKAIKLRKQGKTYKEIRELLGIPKSTLSDWLSKYPLTEQQIELLKSRQQTNKWISVEKTIIKKREKRKERLIKLLHQEQQFFLPLTEKELLIAGLFLYWGEGRKDLGASISLNNTDPQVLKFTLSWLIIGLKVPKEKIKVSLHLYKDMDVPESMNYWHNLLQLPLSQFTKPYIKKSNRTDLDQKGFGHGTCGLIVNDVRLKEKIILGIEAIANFYSGKIEAVI
jgi:hypothetical protein